MTEQSELRDTVLRISGVDVRKCMRCGKCTATCPAYDEMEYHPHQFVAMVEHNRMDELLRSKSLYLCLSCFACVDRCPRQVEPARLVEAVRAVCVRRQGENHMTPDDVPQRLSPALPQQAIVSALRKYAE